MLMPWLGSRPPGDSCAWAGDWEDTGGVAVEGESAEAMIVMRPHGWPEGSLRVCSRAERAGWMYSGKKKGDMHGNLRWRHRQSARIRMDPSQTAASCREPARAFSLAASRCLVVVSGAQRCTWRRRRVSLVNGGRARNSPPSRPAPARVPICQPANCRA